MWIEASRVLTVLGSASITIGLYVQALKAVRTKSMDDFSPVLVISLVVNEVVWLNYGVALGEWPIVLLSGFNIPPVLILTGAYIIHRSRGATS